MTAAGARTPPARSVSWRGEPLFLREIGPADERRHGAFLEHLAPEDLRLRFFSCRHEVPHAELVRLVHPDPARETAFIALSIRPDGSADEMGVARAVADADNVEADFGIIVRSDLKGQGLGDLMLGELIARVRQRGTRRLACEVLQENRRMRALAERRGFQVETGPSGSSPLRYVLALR